MSLSPRIFSLFLSNKQNIYLSHITVPLSITSRITLGLFLALLAPLLNA